MRCQVSVFVVIAVSLPLLTAVSCATKYGYGGQWYSTPDEALAAQKQAHDRLLAQITPAQTRAGGSLAVIMPSDESLLQGLREPGQTSPKPTGGRADFMVRCPKQQYLYVAEAIKRSQIFDKVACRQSDNPEQEHFDEDFALVPSANKAHFLLKSRSPASQNGLPIETGPSSLSALQLQAVWLRNLEETAKKVR